MLSVYLEKHVNYLDIIRNQGIGNGSGQNRPRAWVNQDQPTSTIPLIPPPTPFVLAHTFHQAVILALGALSHYKYLRINNF